MLPWQRVSCPAASVKNDLVHPLNSLSALAHGSNYVSTASATILYMVCAVQQPFRVSATGARAAAPLSATVDLGSPCLCEGSQHEGLCTRPMANARMQKCSMEKCASIAKMWRKVEVVWAGSSRIASPARALALWVQLCRRRRAHVCDMADLDNRTAKMSSVSQRRRCHAR
jgi:hypothetical protein